MGKKGKTTENTNQKLSLAIKSGKHKVGKYFIHIFLSQVLTLHFFTVNLRFQGRHEDAEERTIQTGDHQQQLPSDQEDSARVHGYPWRLQGAPLRWKQRRAR